MTNDSKQTDDETEIPLNVYQTIQMGIDDDNPLFLWMALFQTLNLKATSREDRLHIERDVKIPAQLADYLLRVSFGMQMIAWGKEAEEPTANWRNAQSNFKNIINKNNNKSTNANAQAREVLKALRLSGKSGTGPWSRIRSYARDSLIYTTFYTLVKIGHSKESAYRTISEQQNISKSTVEKSVARGEAAHKLQYTLGKDPFVMPRKPPPKGSSV